MKINSSQEMSLVFTWNSEDGEYQCSDFPAWFTVNDFTNYQTSKITEYLRVEFEILSNLGDGWILAGFDSMEYKKDYETEIVAGKLVCFTVTKTAMLKAISVPFRDPFLSDEVGDTPRPESFLAALRFIGITDCGIPLDVTGGDTPTPTPSEEIEFEAQWTDDEESQYPWPSYDMEMGELTHYPPEYSDFSDHWDTDDANLQLAFHIDDGSDSSIEWGRFEDDGEGNMEYSRTSTITWSDEDGMPETITGWEGRGTYYVTDNREPEPEDEGGVDEGE